jgi:hypothetical protein
MGESGEGRESQGRIETPAAHTIGAIHVTPRESGVGLFFPPMRAAGSALMLALFGMACTVIGLAALAGLAGSGESASASLLALAFAGVFALPLLALGQLFILIALWAAANSLQVEVDSNGLATVRRWFGCRVARRVMLRDDIAAIDSRLAARYVGAFGNSRYYRLIARGRQPHQPPVLIADSLKGSAMTEEFRLLFIEHLALPGLATTGQQAHLVAEDAQ